MSTLTVEEYSAIVQAIAKAGKTTESNIISIYNAFGVDTTNYEEVIGLLPKSFKRYKDLNGNIYYATQASGPVDITDEILEAAQKINSNTKIPKKEFDYVVSESVDAAGKVTPSVGAATTTGTKVAAIGKTVGQAVACASVGISLGKTVSSLLYESGIDLWNLGDMEAYNPDTWGEIVGPDPDFGGKVFNFIFGIKEQTNETQAYIPDRAYAYLAGYLATRGVFPKSAGGNASDIGGSKYSCVLFDAPVEFSIVKADGTPASHTSYRFTVTPSDAKMFAIVCNSEDSYPLDREIIFGAVSPTSSPKIKYGPPTVPFQMDYSTSGSSTLTIDGKKAYISYGTISFILNTTNYSGRKGTVMFFPAENISTKDGNPLPRLVDSTDVYRIGWSGLYGTPKPSGSSIPGIDDYEGALAPDIDGTASIEDILKSLKEQYPELWEKALTTSAVQPDGSLSTTTYIPVPMPNSTGRFDESPLSGSETQLSPSTTPDNSDLIDLITSIISKAPPDNTETGDGDGPPYVPPTGSASSLFAVYNPSQSELDSFGSWLWSGDLIDQLKKLFNDPMQAIIGLHKVFVSPPVGDKVTIKVGFVDSGVSANKVTSQYVTIDCGSIQLNEQFRNVFDYSPYTTIQIYLPFVGVVQLDPADVMRGSISVKYGVDVITGAGLAQVAVTRDNAGGVLYTYPCNCSVTYPVSSGSYIASIGAAIGGAIRGASVGGVIGGIVGAATGALGRGADIAHSGQFTGNSGAIGIKKPYLIISSPQTMLANNFPHFDGKPTNYTVVLGQCTGFTKVSSVHVEGISATSSELDEIESLLKEGVIIGSVSS